VTAAASFQAPVLLVPDLALEHWPSMDRYARELATRVPAAAVPGEARTMRGPRYLARYVRYPRALRRYRPRIVHVADHSYAHCLSAFPRIPSVVTIHDLFPLHVVAAGGWSPRVAVRNRLLQRVLQWTRRADRWIADSAFTAGEAQRLLGLPAERVRVVPLGVAGAFFEAPAPAAVAARRRSWLGRNDAQGARVVLHVGTCAPRKRVETALAAVALLRSRGLDALLVQIGGRFDRSQSRAIEALGLAPFVRQEPAASEPDLITAYAAAEVLLLPSSYEGFGLPALEALAAGLPTVVSGAPALRETVGAAGLVVDADEPEAFARALERVLGDAALRATMAEQGRSRARAMTWERTAAAVTEVYADLGACA